MGNTTSDPDDTPQLNLPPLPPLEFAENPEQEAIFRRDLENFPRNEYTGVYRGIKWKMRRPYGTYWCGYVEAGNEIESSLSDEDYNRIEELSHGELTCGIGFDCAHFYDYVPAAIEGQPSVNVDQNAEYRTYQYVYTTITKMIDYIVDR